MNLPRTPRSILRAALNVGLPIFFTAGGIANLLPSAAIRADYARWGYPDSFHYVTGGLELLAALLLARPQTRDLGRLPGGVAMIGALATLLVFREAPHTLAPAIVLTALGLGRYLDIKAREALWECKAF